MQSAAAFRRRGMRSSDRRKNNTPWILPPGQTRRQIVSIVGLSALVALLAAISAAMWRSGDNTAVAAAKYIAIFAAGMACLLVVALTQYTQIFHRGDLRPGAAAGNTATIAPGSKIYFWAQQTTWLCFAATFLPAAYETATTAWRAYWHFVLILASIGTIATIPLAAALIGRIRPGKLLLTSSEIIHEGWSSRTRLLWDDVNRVRTSFDQVPIIDIVGLSGARWSSTYYLPHSYIAGRPNPFWNLDRPPHTGWIVLECPRFSVDRTVLVRFLNFYAENPRLRTELGTDSALERWRLLASERS